MIIKQIYVFVENKLGRLLKITKILSGNSINIRAFSIADTTNYSIVRLVINKNDDAVMF